MKLSTENVFVVAITFRDYEELAHGGAIAHKAEELGMKPSRFGNPLYHAYETEDEETAKDFIKYIQGSFLIS